MVRELRASDSTLREATTLNSRILNFGTLSSRILNCSKILHTEKCVSACIRGQTCTLVTGPPHITHESRTLGWSVCVYASCARTTYRLSEDCRCLPNYLSKYNQGSSDVLHRCWIPEPSNLPIVSIVVPFWGYLIGS